MGGHMAAEVRKWDLHKEEDRKHVLAVHREVGTKVVGADMILGKQGRPNEVEVFHLLG